ncbi:MAG TPA: STAS domain-containing protein [Candidatus Acidoferrales bacterium]|nr:STAS domain-containing protein [Candidatus Acidoferrales bacterium]
MNLKISARRSGDVTILDLEGRVTIGRDNDSLNNRLQDLAHQDVKKVLVNLSIVSQLDSSGLSTLVRAYISFQNVGGSMKLLHPGGHVREVLELTRLTKTIPTLDDEAVAVASFATTAARPAGT